MVEAQEGIMEISFRKISDLEDAFQHAEEEKSKYEVHFYIFVMENGDELRFDSKGVTLTPDVNPHLENTVKGTIIDAITKYDGRPEYNFVSQGNGVFAVGGFHDRIGRIGHLDSMDKIIEAYVEIIKRHFPRHIEVIGDEWGFDDEAQAYPIEFKIKLI